MALLTESIAPKSAASSILQKHGQDMRNMQYITIQQQQREDNKAERAAEYRGETSAQINTLQAFPGMYKVAQGMYDQYLQFENDGDIENAAYVKKQLDLTLQAMTGYTENFINQKNQLSDDAVLAGYENSYEDLVSIADKYQNKDYNFIGFKNGSFIIEDENGDQFNVQQMPGLSDGKTFLQDELVTPKEALPEGYQDVFGYTAQRANGFLTDDVLNMSTNTIKDEDLLIEKITADFEEKMRLDLNQGQIKTMVYLDQRAKGNMSRYSEDAVLKAMEDGDYVENLKKQYVLDVVDQIKGKLQPIKSDYQQTAEERSNKVNNMVVNDGKTAIITQNQPIRFATGTAGQPGKSMYIIRIYRSTSGVPYVVNSVQSPDPNDPSAMVTTMENLKVTKGSQIYDGLVDYFGGERYLKKALQRIGIDIDALGM